MTGRRGLRKNNSISLKGFPSVNQHDASRTKQPFETGQLDRTRTPQLALSSRSIYPATAHRFLKVFRTVREAPHS